MRAKNKDAGTIPKHYQLHQRLGFQLSRLSRLMQNRLDADLAVHGLTRLKWCVLSGVHIEGYFSPSDLADHIGITRSAISRLLKAMTSEGLIERSLVEADGRSRQITVTPLGREKIALCWPMVEANQDHFLSKLSVERQNALTAALSDMMAGETDKLDDI